jgi:hypothetical protein
MPSLFQAVQKRAIAALFLKIQVARVREEHTSRLNFFHALLSPLSEQPEALDVT